MRGSAWGRRFPASKHPNRGNRPGKAAASVYRHHSTVADRLTRAEAHLGFSFTTPAGRLRLELALLLRNLRDSAEG
ncbi:helix-turn-helix domain-containing protein [Streptomyces sp. FXJ1.4098]|nr:helix-turn-helix domain-containing protein [Streptomyces sp. FXJ1.4098]